LKGKKIKNSNGEQNKKFKTIERRLKEKRKKESCNKKQNNSFLKKKG
jgi:hypothetical protein